MKKIYISVFAMLLGYWGTAQNTYPLQYGSESHHLLDRLDIKGVLPIGHTAMKPLDRGAVAKALKKDSLANETDINDIQFLKNDNSDFFVGDKRIKSQNNFLQIFYETPAQFYELHKPDFNLYINPILQLKAGYEKDNNGSGLIFDNRRGIEVRGDIDKKVYFYTRMVESQTKFPFYQMQKIQSDQAVPGAGYYKEYDSKLTKGEGLDGYDYLQAQGSVGFNFTKHIGAQVGHGRNFIGDGYRSLLLSDYSNDYFYLKFNTRIWKLNYQNLFAQLTGDYTRGADKILPKKYLAAHHLSLDLAKNFNIGLYEAVVLSRSNGFELQYLNPIMFYRSVEHALGSPDNVILGANMKWNIARKLSLYGQFVLDEFNFSQVLKRNGWWSNKYGIQGGIKYIDAFGISHLDMQLEFNMVRPYTFSHDSSDANYTHYNQPLAHPLGANFREAIAIVRWQPAPKVLLTGRVVYSQFGLDTLSSNWGGNIKLPNITHEQDTENKIGQGVFSNQLYVSGVLSYQFKHNLSFELEAFYRRRDSDINNFDTNSLYFGAGIRYNLADRRFDF